MVLLWLAEKSIAMSEKFKDSKEVTSSFTVDSDNSSPITMPTLTRLLNRKKFAKSETSVTNTATTTATTGISPVPPIFEKNPKSSLTPPKPPEDATKLIKESVRKVSRKREAKPLVIWTPAALASGKDPLGKAIISLLTHGASQALFLAIQSQAGGPSPMFTATAAVNAREKEKVWNGLRWDPSLLPDVWQQVISTGYVELLPPGTMTNIQSDRNVSRAAFDVTQEEGLYFVRVGTSQQCRGILVLVSLKPLIHAIQAVMPLLVTLPESLKKSA
jgi:hypothetical protein